MAMLRNVRRQLRAPGDENVGAWLVLVALLATHGSCLVDRSLKNRCRGDDDCASGRRCVGGFCQAGSATPPADAVAEGPGVDTSLSPDRMQPVADAARDQFPPIEGGSSPEAGGAADRVSDGTPNTVFVTSRTYAPNFGSAETADRYCNDSAQAAGISGVFRAWISTAAVDARDRLQGARGWVRPDGLPFADTIDDIVGGRIFYPPSIDELGQQVLSNPDFIDYAVTGTTEFGVLSAEDNCHDWEYGFFAAAVQAGFADSTRMYWTAGTGMSCDQKGRLYCFGVDRVATVTLPSAPVGSRLAFISTAPFAPSLGIGAADAICNSEAAGAGLPGMFYALLATQAAAASTRFTAGGTWTRPDGLVLNRPGSDLFVAGPLAPINVTARGTYGKELSVLTGAATATAPADPSWNCSDWTDDSAANYSYRGMATTLWGWFSAYRFHQCSYPLPIYCLQR